MRITGQPTLYNTNTGAVTITPTVSDTTGTVTYHWYKNPNRVVHTIENMTVDAVYPEGFSDYSVGYNNFSITDTTQVGDSIVDWQAVELKHGKMCFKCRIETDVMPDYPNGDYLMFTLKDVNYPAYRWMGVWLTGNVTPQNEIYVVVGDNGFSIAPVAPTR